VMVGGLGVCVGVGVGGRGVLVGVGCGVDVGVLVVVDVFVGWTFTVGFTVGLEVGIVVDTAERVGVIDKAGLTVFASEVGVGKD